jgi:long-chain acyl-CoA synthetase
MSDNAAVQGLRVPATMQPADILRRDFATLSDLLRAHARVNPRHTALIHDGATVNYARLDQIADRVAAALQRDGIAPRETIAICAATTIDYLAIFLGSLRAGVAVAPLPSPVQPRGLRAMIVDSGARILFADHAIVDGPAPGGDPMIVTIGAAEPAGLQRWLADATPSHVDVRPDWAFNIIYSSGTTGMPKGILQPHIFRWFNIQRAVMYGYDGGSVALLATPIYSNLTLATLFGVLAVGGTAVLLEKFGADAYLAAARDFRATHTMLVPVQYQRLLAHEHFGGYDLSSLRMKFSTGAPFAAALKTALLERWPGGLIEIYAMTEGGGACMLEAHKHRDKLHTVGTPMRRNDIRLLDASDRELPAGHPGEIVGHSPAMMTCYLNQPAKTAEAEWHDAGGKRFIRSGDIGCVDANGFLILLDRKKDMIISGGFNIYPSDLEAVLREHPGVAEAAVVGVSSVRWGETPVACVVLEEGADADAAGVAAWANARLGKIQRISAVKILTSLPRSAAGKILKRELRDEFA